MGRKDCLKGPEIDKLSGRRKEVFLQAAKVSLIANPPMIVRLE